MSFSEWLSEIQKDPVFKGADWSRADILEGFYNDYALWMPHPELRRMWEGQLADRLRR